MPATFWVAFCVIWLVLTALDVPNSFDGRSMTLTEATAVASYADTARLLEKGADPNARARLRAGLVKNNASTMTPLEAATGAIRTGPVQMLVEHGATIDDTNYPVLWCAATARHNQDMLQFLQTHRPAGTSVDCARTRPLW